MSITNPGAPKSFHEEVKEAKAFLSNSTELTEAKKLVNKYRSNGESSGNKNLCVFGKPNANFNKYNV